MTHTTSPNTAFIPFHRILLAAVVGLTLAAGSALATPVATSVSTTGNGYVVSSSDLINGIGGVVVGSLGSEEGLNSNTSGSALTDGGFGSVNIDGSDNSGLVQVHSNTTITYALPASVSGFTVSTINSYTGWRDHGRYQQDYRVLFAFASNPTAYVEMFTVAADPTDGIDAMVSTSGVGGVALADHVVGIRFDFTAVQNGYVGYRELDVIGAASVPEPSSLMLVGLGVLALVGMRRKVYRNT